LLSSFRAAGPNCLQDRNFVIDFLLAVFESDGNAQERRSRSFLNNGNVVLVVFSVYFI